MKFLYFQDAHIQGKNSRNRLGNYFIDCLLKFDEIISLAKEHKCEAIIDGGDLYESDKPAYNVLDAIADRLEKANLPMYSLYGNHAMSYAHIENSNNTGLAHLQKRSKYFKYLTDIECNQFIIKGFEYNFGIENEIKEKGLWIPSPIMKECDQFEGWRIGILHALVTPGKFFDNTSYIQCKDIKTNGDLILLAHYHTPFKKEINGTTFLNIGCSGRLNINEAKIEPSVLLIDTDKRSYEIIKLKSAKPTNEIFDLTKYEELKENERNIEDFISLLNSAKFQSCDIANQIELIGKENNVDKEVINYLLEKIGEQV